MKYTAIALKCRSANYIASNIGAGIRNYTFDPTSYGFAVGNETWLKEQVANVGPISGRDII